MSHTEDTTRELVRAIVQLEPLNGRAYASADVFQDMAADYRSGHDTWREVTPQFVRYCMEVMPPIDGPDGSRSFALGECFAATRKGAIHCVIARESGRQFAKYVNLMLWSDELLGLRNILAVTPDVCGLDCDSCDRSACTGANKIGRKNDRG